MMFYSSSFPMLAKMQAFEKYYKVLNESITSETERFYFKFKIWNFVIEISYYGKLDMHFVHL